MTGKVLCAVAAAGLLAACEARFGNDAGEVAVLRQPLRGRLGADAGDAGQVVRGLSHHGREVAVALRPDAVLLLGPAGFEPEAVAGGEAPAEIARRVGEVRPLAPVERERHRSLPLDEAVLGAIGITDPEDVENITKSKFTGVGGLLVSFKTEDGIKDALKVDPPASSLLWDFVERFTSEQIGTMY